MDYKKLAQEIVTNVGDVDNIQTLSHCMTRLRFQLKDASKANKEALENLEGVLGVVYAGGQYMVILGQHLLQTYDVMMNDSCSTNLWQNCFSSCCWNYCGYCCCSGCNLSTWN